MVAPTFLSIKLFDKPEFVGAGIAVVMLDNPGKVYYCISEVVQLESKGGRYVIWKIDKNRAICPQIVQQLCAGIAAGEFTSGQRLMSVRELALAAGVNPNTVQRAFEQLEQQGVLYSVRGAGWYVSADTNAAYALRTDLVQQTLQDFFDKMIALGIEPEETKKRVKEWQL